MLCFALILCMHILGTSADFEYVPPPKWDLTQKWWRSWSCRIFMQLSQMLKCYIIFTLYSPFNPPAEGQTTVEDYCFMLVTVISYRMRSSRFFLAAGIAFTTFLTTLNTALQQRAEQVKTVTEQISKSWIHPMEQLHRSNQTPPFEVAAY